MIWPRRQLLTHAAALLVPLIGDRDLALCVLGARAVLHAGAAGPAAAAAARALICHLEPRSVALLAASDEVLAGGAPTAAEGEALGRLVRRQESDGDLQASARELLGHLYECYAGTRHGEVPRAAKATGTTALPSPPTAWISFPVLIRLTGQLC